MSTGTALAGLARMIAAGATLAVTMDDELSVPPLPVLWARVGDGRLTWLWAGDERDHSVAIEAAEGDDEEVTVTGDGKVLLFEPFWNDAQQEEMARKARAHGRGPYGPAGAWCYVAR